MYNLSEQETHRSVGLQQNFVCFARQTFVITGNINTTLVHSIRCKGLSLALHSRHNNY